MSVEHITRLSCDVQGCSSVIEVESYPGTEGDYGYDGYDEKWIERPCVDFDWPRGWNGAKYNVKCPLHSGDVV